jgi:outer membrane protein OmpA-like peptidoglycan-associated protein/tetratricopeptide (TPR) repeat protein
MPPSNKVKQTFVLSFLLLSFSFAKAQSFKDHVQKADRYYLKKDFANALKGYEAALSLDATDPLVNFKAGIASLEEERYSQAVAFLERAYELKPDVDEGINYHLAMSYQKDHQFDKARQQFEILKKKNKKLAPVANQKIAECLLADSVMRVPANADIHAVKGEVNTPFAELAPLISSDGKILIFTSNRTEDAYQAKSGTNAGDIFTSKLSGGEWREAERIGGSINVKLHEAGTSLSADDKTLLLYYEDGGGDIYSSSLQDESWTKPVALNQFINHPQYREAGACLSPDGKKLYFSSNRPGGRGGYDLYVSELGANGQWGRPSNLGSPVNTRRDETSPFLDAPGTTLYFASDGHATLGDKDIFKSALQNGKWSTPQNLGYPINTSAYEEHFVLTGDGALGFLTSRRDREPGNTDIYQVRFKATTPEVPSTQATETIAHTGSVITLLKGTVIDVNDASPLKATLSLVDNATKKIVSKVETDDSGNFQITIPVGGNYGLTTEREGYLFNSMNFNLPPFERYQEIDTHILMVKARVGSKVILKNIFFDVNQSALKSESLSELENIRDLLTQHSQWRIQINGHTDNAGTRELNLALSQKRAQAVVDYLVEQGIARDRLKAKGFGADEPLVSNDDEKDGRQINRRTEIEIISQ